MLPQQDRSLIASCCHAGPRWAHPSQRGWQIVGGVLSIAVWIFMPKCPLCVAAHVALWTGLGLSLTEASLLRSLLLLLSSLLLFYIITKRVWVHWRHRRRDDASMSRAAACCEGMPCVSDR